MANLNYEEAKKHYADFLTNYKTGQSNAESIGEEIAILVQYFSDVNIDKANAEIAYNSVATKIEGSMDDKGKPISSAKAKILSSSTPECEKYIIKKAEVENIEQMLNALKSLQRGLINEFNYQGNT